MSANLEEMAEEADRAIESDISVLEAVQDIEEASGAAVDYQKTVDNYLEGECPLSLDSNLSFIEPPLKQ